MKEGDQLRQIIFGSKEVSHWYIQYLAKLG